MVEAIRLPEELLLLITNHLDLASKGCFALTSKFFYNLLDGKALLKWIRIDVKARREFLRLLERDLPLPLIFCPTCITLHKLPQSPIQGTSNPKRHWKCVTDDIRNEVDLFLGKDFHYIQARMALRLFQQQDPNAKTYLANLEAFELRRSMFQEFRRRELRIVQLPGEFRPQLFMRMQHWLLLSKKELATIKLDHFNNSTVLICYHRINPGTNYLASTTPIFWQGVKDARTMQRGLDAEPVPAETDKSALRHRLSSMIRGKQSEQPTDRAVNDIPSACRDVKHEHSELSHCLSCNTDYRLDVVCLQQSSHSQHSSSLLQRPKSWGIAVTKWMKLGTLECQDSLDWQGHAYFKRYRSVVRTVSSERLAPGGILLAFEDSEEYEPVWSSELEQGYRNAVRNATRDTRRDTWSVLMPKSRSMVGL